MFGSFPDLYLQTRSQNRQCIVAEFRGTNSLSPSSAQHNISRNPPCDADRWCRDTLHAIDHYAFRNQQMTSLRGIAKSAGRNEEQQKTTTRPSVIAPKAGCGGLLRRLLVSQRLHAPDQCEFGRTRRLDTCAYLYLEPRAQRMLLRALEDDTKRCTG